MRHLLWYRVPVLRRVFRRPGTSVHDVRSRVDEELELHLDMCVEELIEDGLSPEQARQVARHTFGELEFTREYCVEQGVRRGVLEERIHEHPAPECRHRGHHLGWA